ncbi:MAG: hypothetical protein WA734_11995 [Candidatus Acidiferrales bacterium]
MRTAENAEPAFVALVMYRPATAAPDMLEALKDVTAWFEEYPPHSHVEYVQNLPLSVLALPRRTQGSKSES